MVQWVRICLEMQGTWFNSGLGTNILHAREQLSLPTTTRESMHCNNRSHMVQSGYYVLQLRPNAAKYINNGEKRIKEVSVQFSHSVMSESL